MSKLLNNLENYGVDLKTTMTRFVDDESLFVHCLSMFFEGKEFAQLDAAMAANDYKAAFEAAHTIKGLTGNLGLTPLYNKVCELVEPLRHGQTENVAALYGEVTKEMKKAESVWNMSKE